MSVDIKELRQLSQGLKVLYVEDESETRKSTYRLLHNFFEDIMIASDGVDGLEKFRTEAFDLILTDINMPRMNGLDMLKEIRDEDDTISVVVLSAYNDSKDFLQAIELNVDGYILKPLNQEQFLRSILKIVQKIRAAKDHRNYQITLEEEVKKRNEELSHKLHHDALTKLRSRYAFFKDIKKRDKPEVYLIDIDKFRVINEVYGSAIGSEILEKFAQKLTQIVAQREASLYRITSDEFALICEAKNSDEAEHTQNIEALFKALNNTDIVVEEYLISLSVTIGFSCVVKNSYESAKIALDYAKENHKPFTIYSSSIDHRKESSLSLQCRNDISNAIEHNGVVAVYQGIVDKRGSLVKYEALMRLREKESDKLISPFYFLDVAIKTRLYETLSTTVIFQALEVAQSSGKDVSINFTYNDIKNSDLVRDLKVYFDLHPGIGRQIVFEITESQAIENYSDVQNFIQDFRVYGVQIAIDDFGSGFSNFAYILELRPDYLKIDGSLIKNIDTDSRAYTLVEAIVQFSHKLHIKVIAEFVHSELIFDMLKKLDVDEYQGFYFYEPEEKMEELKCA